MRSSAHKSLILCIESITFHIHFFSLAAIIPNVPTNSGTTLGFIFVYKSLYLHQKSYHPRIHYSIYLNQNNQIIGNKKKNHKIFLMNLQSLKALDAISILHYGL